MSFLRLFIGYLLIYRYNSNEYRNGIIDSVWVSPSEVRLRRPSRPSVVSPHSYSRIIRRCESNAEAFKGYTKMRPAVQTRVSGLPILSPWKIVRSSPFSSPAIAMSTSGSECTDMSRAKLPQTLGTMLTRQQSTVSYSRIFNCSCVHRMRHQLYLWCLPGALRFHVENPKHSIHWGFTSTD